MKRWLAIVVGLAVAAGWLVLQARPAAPSDRPIELRVWDWWSPTSSEDYQRYFAAVKKRFEQDHPGIRVRYQFVPFSNYVQKLTTAYCGPNPPDVYQCSVAWAQTLWQRGVLLDLTELVARTPELAIEKFLPAAVRHNQSNGRIFGIPIILDAECLIYNLDMFERAGLPTEPEAIKSWQDFRRFARALTGLNDRGEKVFGFGFSGYGTGLTVFSPLLCANGGQFAGGRPIRAMFNSQQGV
ncbi:MAG: ABC transporter substrate-binding protein, partial [Phycisphaerae bacterium]